jgi:phosphate transport system permease protein
MISTLQRSKENSIHALLLACALLSILTTAGIIWVLTQESFEFFTVDGVSPVAFLTGGRWAPLSPEGQRSFGVLPLICGTMMVALGGLLVAVPVGLASAVYLSEYAPRVVQQVLKPLLEILAGIPTVVYGYFALTFITPCVLRPAMSALGIQVEVFNAASAAVVVGVMIIPTIASLCDDAFRAVPRSLREGAYALAATRLEVSTRVVLPAALSGVVAAVLLALARAIGETMAVAMAAGMTPKLTLNIFESIQTLTAYIVQVSMGDTPAGTVEYRSIFAVGMLLFVITLGINIIAHRVLKRFREVYE